MNKLPIESSKRLSRVFRPTHTDYSKTRRTPQRLPLNALQSRTKKFRTPHRVTTNLVTKQPCLKTRSGSRTMSLRFRTISANSGRQG